jgi:hypothetical protein
MKFKKIYFAFLFLTSFLTSLGFNVYIGNISFTKKTTVTFTENTQVATSASQGTSQDNLLFEENENEQEKDGFETQVCFIQFLFSYFQIEVSQPHFFSAQPLAESFHNPIYIAVRNFRI